MGNLSHWLLQNEARIKRKYNKKVEEEEVNVMNQNKIPENSWIYTRDVNSLQKKKSQITFATSE